MATSLAPNTEDDDVVSTTTSYNRMVMIVIVYCGPNLDKKQSCLMNK